MASVAEIKRCVLFGHLNPDTQELQVCPAALAGNGPYIYLVLIGEYKGGVSPLIGHHGIQRYPVICLGMNG